MQELAEELGLELAPAMVRELALGLGLARALALVPVQELAQAGLELELGPQVQALGAWALALEPVQVAQAWLW